MTTPSKIWLLLSYKVPREPTANRVSVWRKLKKGSSDSDAGRPLGPVATAETVSPPADAAVESAGTEAHAS